MQDIEERPASGVDTVREAHRPSSGYFFPFLDGMRGIAVTLVVIHHCFYVNPSTPLLKFVLALIAAGYMGVPIFFTLSGFLISLAVFSSPQPFDWYAYACRRSAKIIPPFFLSLAIFALCTWPILGARYSLTALAGDVTTVNNVLLGPTLNPSYWSLYVEIHFYILLPLIYLGFSRITSHAKIFTCLVFLIIPIAFRLDDYREARLIPPSTFPRSFDYFSGGMLFAWLFIHHRHNELLKKWSSTIASAGMVLLVASLVLTSLLNDRYGAGLTRNLAVYETLAHLPCVASALVLFLCFEPKGILPQILTFRPLAYLGLVSYEWYLLHMPPAMALREYLKSAHGSLWIYAGRCLLPSLGSLLAAMLIYHLFSAPILAWTKIHLRKRSRLPRG